jgi:hypothetical protein
MPIFFAATGLQSSRAGKELQESACDLPLPQLPSNSIPVAQNVPPIPATIGRAHELPRRPYQLDPVSEILPDGDTEKQLMQGLLNQREKLDQEPSLF